MERRLASLARTQSGCLTVPQVLRHGIPSDEVLRRLLDGEWVRPQPGVVVAATQPIGLPTAARAALLSIGGEVALGVRTAGWAWHMDPLAVPARPELVVPGDRRFTHMADVAVRTGGPAPLEGPAPRPVAGASPGGRGPADRCSGFSEEMRDLVQQLLLERRTTIDRLRAVLGRGLDGSAALREVLWRSIRRATCSGSG